MMGFGNGATASVSISTSGGSGAGDDKFAQIVELAKAGESKCIPGTESWCYNPLVMYLREKRTGTLSKGTLTKIRDEFKQALAQPLPPYNTPYIPTSDPNVLPTPTKAVTQAVLTYQPGLAQYYGSQVYDLLTQDALAANKAAQAAAWAGTLQKIRLPSPVVAMPAAAPMPVGMPRTVTVAPAKPFPWLWVGAGAVVLGGAAWFLMKKKA